MSSKPIKPDYEGSLEHFCAEAVGGKITPEELDAVIGAMARGTIKELNTENLTDHINWVINLKTSMMLYDLLMEQRINFTGKTEDGQISFEWPEAVSKEA